MLRILVLSLACLVVHFGAYAESSTSKNLCDDSMEEVVHNCEKIEMKYAEISEALDTAKGFAVECRDELNSIPKECRSHQDFLSLEEDINDAQNVAQELQRRTPTEDTLVKPNIPIKEAISDWVTSLWGGSFPKGMQRSDASKAKLTVPNFIHKKSPRVEDRTSAQPSSQRER